jgi:hypothetical protein
LASKALISPAFRSSLDGLYSDKRDVHVAVPKAEKLLFTKPSLSEIEVYSCSGFWR